METPGVQTARVDKRVVLGVALPLAGLLVGPGVASVVDAHDFRCAGLVTPWTVAVVIGLLLGGVGGLGLNTWAVLHGQQPSALVLTGWALTIALASWFAWGDQLRAMQAGGPHQPRCGAHAEPGF
jgi:hypothetical protein